MIGKASELKVKRIVKTRLFSFNLKDHENDKNLHELVEAWLENKPNALIQTISCYAVDTREIAMIIYKEADTNA